MEKYEYVRINLLDIQKEFVKEYDIIQVSQKWMDLFRYSPWLLWLTAIRPTRQ